jgi:hypothetical protein
MTSKGQVTIPKALRQQLGLCGPPPSTVTRARWKAQRLAVPTTVGSN